MSDIVPVDGKSRWAQFWDLCERKTVPVTFFIRIMKLMPTLMAAWAIKKAFEEEA